MTYATVRAAAEHIARAGKITPHQLAALTAHDESLTDAQRQEFTELWRAAGSPAAAVPTLVSMAQAAAVFTKAPSASQLADLNACLARFNINTPVRIQHFLAQVGHESGGLKWMLELASGDAYEGRKDLGNTQQGDGPRFKGAGAIQLTGRFNYQKFADYIKDPDVMDGAAYVASRYPFSSAGFWWHQNAINAFVDQGANCRQVSAKVNGRDPANGLADREAYFTKAAAAIPQQAPPPLPLQQGALLAVPYEAQNDNASGTGYRECFSSSAAMVARYYGKIPSDDAYNKFRAKYGDTTDAQAQLKALSALGLTARFITTCTVALLEAELDAGRPVMVGWLHKGPVNAPTGGGHWSVVVGYTPTGFIHNDPNGEANLVAGGYINTTKGKAVAYSRANWLKRWLVEGPNSGWALLVSR
jgi:predicted chitinase